MLRVGGAGGPTGNLNTTWREGEVLILDDSFEHELWGVGLSAESREPRVLLIVDVHHPGIAADALASMKPGCLN